MADLQVVIACAKPTVVRMTRSLMPENSDDGKLLQGKKTYRLRVARQNALQRAQEASVYHLW